MRFNLSQAAFSPLHKQSVGGLLSTSLVAKWTFLCVAPLAFALTNTGALTRGWGPRQGCWSSVWYGLLRVWSPSTHTAVAEQTNLSMVSVVFVLYTVYICMHQQTYTLSLLLVFFFLLGYSNHPFILITILSCLCESSVHGSLWRVGGLQTLCLPTVQSILPSLFCPHSCFCFFFASLLLCISLVCGGGSPVKNSVLVSLTKTCQNKIYPEKVNIFRSLQVTVIVINFWSSWLAEPLFSFSEKKLKVSLAVCLHPPSFHLHLKTQGKIRF